MGVMLLRGGGRVEAVAERGGMRGAVADDAPDTDGVEERVAVASRLTPPTSEPGELDENDMLMADGGEGCCNERGYCRGGRVTVDVIRYRF